MQAIDHSTEAGSKRLSKAERRRQLLAVAKTFIASEPVEDLTLAVLAERAGVSKPIAYDHFGSRSGLLIALLDETSQYYELDAEAKLAAAPQTLQAIAEIVAAAYVQCAIAAGPAMSILAAAAEADSEARAAGRALQRDHAASFKRAFTPVLSDAPDHLDPLIKALVAAANAICDDRTQDKITTKVATQTLTHLLVTSLQPFALDPAQTRRAE